MNYAEASPPGSRGTGQFRHATGPNPPAVRSGVSRRSRRIQFLEAGNECYPQVLSSLREQPVGDECTKAPAITGGPLPRATASERNEDAREAGDRHGDLGDEREEVGRIHA